MKKLRIKKLVRLFELPKNKTEKLAYRYLFSTLTALESIAVLAAEQGAGVVGQLEDEYVHMGTFKRLADLCGGYEEPCEATQRLIDYLESLKGESSIAALNVVAEGWLGCVFEGLSKLSPELFNSIGEDEARHNGYALSFRVGESEEVEPIIRNLETLLFNIIQSPNFMAPLVYLLGLPDMFKVGMAIIESHKKASEHLGVVPQLKEVKYLCRATLLSIKNYPEKLDMNNWQQNKTKIWKNHAPMVMFKEMKIDSKNVIAMHAKVISAISKVTKYHPNFRNVIRDNTLYRTKSSIVGMRVMWDEDQLTTIYLNSGQGYKKVLKRIIRRTKKVKEHAYEKLLEVDHIKELFPPAQCPILLSYVGFHDSEEYPTWGWGPPSEIEGAAISVFIYAPTVKEGEYWRFRTVTVMDHRVHDGHDISYFTDRLCYYLQNND